MASSSSPLTSRLVRVVANVKSRAIRAPERPVLDEESFQQLLAAAFVLQEHNDRLRAKEPQVDYTRGLSVIAETQRLIQNRQLDLSAAAQLIAEQTLEVTHATGTAIAVVQGDKLVYRAGAGSAAGTAGSQVSVDSSLSAVCVRQGTILQCLDTQKDPCLPVELCRAERAQSLLAIPVFDEGKVAGVLELRFAQPNSFREHDVHTAQLMAGLVTEALARAAELDWKQALAAERAAMLKALEKLKPQLERLAEPATPPEKTDAPNTTGESTAAQVDAALLASSAGPTPGSGEPSADTTNSIAPSGLQSPAASVAHPPEPDVRPDGATPCRVCDHPMAEQEFFCGICGTARVGEIPVGTGRTRSNSVVRLQQAGERKREEISQQKPSSTDASEETVVLPASFDEIVAQYAAADTTHVGGDSIEKEKKCDAHFTSTEDTPVLPRAARSLRFARTANEVAGNEDSAAEEANVEAATEAGIELTPEEEVQLAIMRSNIPAPAEVALRSPWTSAHKARQWLESLKAQQQPGRLWLSQQWHNHRANLYVAASAFVLLVVLIQVVFSGGNRQSASDPGSANPAAAANTRRRLPAKPQLTLFEQILVGLGLAEPPPAPTYLGNPDAQVWVDLHTALYYCPGADLYGKTSDGKFTTQRDAQQDQFEPARRRACD